MPQLPNYEYAGARATFEGYIDVVGELILRWHHVNGIRHITNYRFWGTSPIPSPGPGEQFRPVWLGSGPFPSRKDLHKPFSPPVLDPDSTDSEELRKLLATTARVGPVGPPTLSLGDLVQMARAGDRSALHTLMNSARSNQDARNALRGIYDRRECPEVAVPHIEAILFGAPRARPPF